MPKSFRRLLFAVLCFAAPLQSGPLTDALMKEMSIEEKVGQLLMVHFNGEIGNDEAKMLLQQAHAGAVIYYNWANGLHSPQQVLELSNSLQNMAKIPLLIAVDQEGGRISRLTEGFTRFPSNSVIGQHPDSARSYAAALAGELRSVGVNMNLAPVVDINSNPHNTVIGDRSFGSSPELVADLAAATLEGYRQASIIGTLKHFPGHGDVEVDSHAALPVLLKSREELNRCELVPYKKLASTAEAIMTGHIVVPAIDEKKCATLSHKVLEGVLRTDLGFNGVILSDSLIMEGVLKDAGNIENAAVLAIQAGCDLLILGGASTDWEQKRLRIDR